MKPLSIILLLLFSSCIKEIELDFGNIKPQLVVNCLFAEDKPWELFLTWTKSASDAEDPVIENARVVIVDESQNSIELVYQGKGVYRSGHHPEKGITYHLQIDVPGHETVSATNSIPASIDISNINFTDKQTSYFFTNTMENFDVAPLSFDVESSSEAFVRFRFYTFNTNSGYLRYCLPADSLEVLRKDGLPECVLEKLADISDVVFTTSEFHKLNSKIYEGCGYYQTDVYNKFVRFRVEERIFEAFLIDDIFSTSNWAHNVSIDFRTVLGTFNKQEKANLFVAHKSIFNKTNKIENYLEVTSMSKDYYKYQESYIRQAFQAANPYVDVVQVYSNITNGVGIFAGYNRQMVHFFDY